MNCMRALLLLAVTCTALSVSAQAVLDFPDYRSKKDNFAKVTDPVIHHDLVFFTLAGLDLRVGQPMSTSIPIAAHGADFITFSDGNIQVTIRSTPFETGKRKMGYIEKHLVRIDNKPYFGNYGEVPETAIQSVMLIEGKDTVRVPQAALADLYQPLFMYTEGGTTKTHDGVYLSPDKQTIYIYMLNKEVNGYYEVTWVIRAHQYLRRVVDTNI